MHPADRGILCSRARGSSCADHGKSPLRYVGRGRERTIFYGGEWRRCYRWQKGIAARQLIRQPPCPNSVRRRKLQRCAHCTNRHRGRYRWLRRRCASSSKVTREMAHPGVSTENEAFKKHTFVWHSRGFKLIHRDCPILRCVFSAVAAGPCPP